MTDEEFRDQLDRYGGDLALWPAPAARDARRLLLRSVKAQAMLDETVTMELALGELALGELAPEELAPGRPDDRPPPGLADRIFTAAFRLPPSEHGFDEDGDQPPRLM